jgi:hypothetical protein
VPPSFVQYTQNLFCYGEPVEITDSSLKDGKLTLTTKKPLVSSADCLLTILWGEGFCEAIPHGAYDSKRFMTNRAPFDIVDFEFYESDGKIGAVAKVYNDRSWEARTAVMVMLLLDERGAVQGIYSSEVINAYNATGAITLFDIEIQPVETYGHNVQVFFLSDWDDYLCIKNQIYKYKKEGVFN